MDMSISKVKERAREKNLKEKEMRKNWWLAMGLRSGQNRPLLARVVGVRVA
jgi:hypothetical protein